NALYQHNFQKWGQVCDLISLGQGAYWNLGNVQYINHEKSKDYASSIESGNLPIERATKLSNDEMMRRHMILGMKTGVNIQDFETRYGTHPLNTSFGSVIETLLQVGAIEETETGYKISLAGQLAGAGSVQNKFYSPETKAICEAREEKIHNVKITPRIIPVELNDSLPLNNG
ncbi:MAG: hypothetical protein WBK77_07890, partial [Alphaproteobacteria bacterium]